MVRIVRWGSLSKESAPGRFTRSGLLTPAPHLKPLSTQYYNLYHLQITCMNKNRGEAATAGRLPADRLQTAGRELKKPSCPARRPFWRTNPTPVHQTPARLPSLKPSTVDCSTPAALLGQVTSRRRPGNVPRGPEGPGMITIMST